jgi:hypothetical protein
MGVVPHLRCTGLGVSTHSVVNNLLKLAKPPLVTINRCFYSPKVRLSGPKSPLTRLGQTCMQSLLLSHAVFHLAFSLDCRFSYPYIFIYPQPSFSPKADT